MITNVEVLRRRVSACVTYSSHGRGGAMMSMFTQCGLRGDGEGGAKQQQTFAV